MKKFNLGRHLVGKSPGNNLPGHVQPKPPDEDMDEYMEHMKGFYPMGVYMDTNSETRKDKA